MKYVRLFEAVAFALLCIIIISYLYGKLAIWTNGWSAYLIPAILLGPIITSAVIVSVHDIYEGIKKRMKSK